jgi:PAS domain-containing protein
MLHPDDRDAVVAESNRTNVSGEPFDLEYRLVAKDGRTVWVTTTLHWWTTSTDSPRGRAS